MVRISIYRGSLSSVTTAENAAHAISGLHNPPFSVCGVTPRGTSVAFFR
jgi:hypothetical protein